MNRIISKPKKSSSPLAAQMVHGLQKEKSDVLFMDNRKEAVQMRKLIRHIENNIGKKGTDFSPLTYIPAQHKSVVQKKRDIHHAQALEDFNKNKERGDDALEDDTLDVVNQNYQASLKSGRSLMEKGLHWFVNSPEKEKQDDSQYEVYDKVLKAGYKVFWFFPAKDSVTICMIRGNKYEHLENGEVSGYDFDDLFGDDQDYFYANTYNVKTGEFHASINYRNADSKVAKKQGLPPALNNSEIIWFQQAHAKDVYQEKYPDEQNNVKSITSISRIAIGNTRTLDTIFMADDQRTAYQGGEVRLDAPTEEAKALLGTPNGNSAMWVLIRHVKSGSLDIEAIEFTKNSLTIHYMEV